MYIQATVHIQATFQAALHFPTFLNDPIKYFSIIQIGKTILMGIHNYILHQSNHKTIEPCQF